MRLFIAINFNDEIKDGLFAAANLLKNHSAKGSFTRRENFHLTVAFIGETSKVNEIKAAMDHIDVRSFYLTIKGFGAFRRKGSGIYWVGVEKNEVLTRLHRQLTRVLRCRFHDRRQRI